VGKIQQEFRIVMMEMGSRHCLVLTRPERESEKTKVWAFGRNIKGQLGSGSRDASSHAVASVIVFFAKNDKIRVQSISCGGDFNAALASSGDLYMWYERCFFR